MIWTTTKTFDDILDRFNIMNDTWNFNSNVLSPLARVKTEDNAHVISIAVPGLERSDISIEFDRAENLLEIEYNGKGNDFVSKFKKSYQVPLSIDTEAIKVDLTNGILVVTLPKKEDQTRIKVL